MGEMERLRVNEAQSDKHAPESASLTGLKDAT